jgi:hypothetical protein
LYVSLLKVIITTIDTFQSQCHDDENDSDCPYAGRRRGCLQ